MTARSILGAAFAVVAALSGCSAACVRPAEITGTHNGTHATVRCTLAEGDCATGWVYSRGSGKLACGDGRVLAQLPAGVTATVVP